MRCSCMHALCGTTRRYGLAYVHLIEPRVRRGAAGWESVGQSDEPGNPTLLPFRLVSWGLGQQGRDGIDESEGPSRWGWCCILS